MTSDVPPDPGLDAYWAAIDAASDTRDAAFQEAIGIYESAIKQARANYLAYQNQRNALRESARSGVGQRGGQ